MMLNELYRRFLVVLQNVYDTGEASNMTSIVFEYFAGVSKSDVIKNPSLIINEQTEKKLNECLQDLLQHKPVQYLTGEAWFYKMKLKVTPAVLIPRPETEELVMKAIEFIQQPHFSALDIGTGSGCISIAIKKNKPDATITAIDISEEALKIARENAQQQKVDIDFRLLNFLEEANWPTLKSYDIIISNPPYIPNNEKEELDKNVSLYEPHNALFVSSNTPLVFYEKIAAFGKNNLCEGGRIFLETHERFANDVAALFKQQGYETRIHKDMFGKERMVIAFRSQ